VHGGVATRRRLPSGPAAVYHRLAVALEHHAGVGDESAAVAGALIGRFGHHFPGLELARRSRRQELVEQAFVAGAFLEDARIDSRVTGTMLSETSPKRLTQGMSAVPSSIRNRSFSAASSTLPDNADIARPVR
jgi:hypothetical protein